MSEKKEFSLGKVFKKAAKYAAFGVFSFFILGGLDFIFFHELGAGQAFSAALRPIGDAIFLTDIPIIGASIEDGMYNVADMITNVVGPDVSEAGAFAEAYTPMAPNAF